MEAKQHLQKTVEELKVTNPSIPVRPDLLIMRAAEYLMTAKRHV